MTSALHLLTGDDPAPLLVMIEQQRRDPSTTVTVVLLPGATVAPLPDDVRVRRVDHDLSYSDLLDLIFASDHVVTW
jgi:hypothetical protein